MQRSDKPWTAAVAAARANVSYVRVSPRKSPRNHHSNHPPTWVAVPDRQSDGSSSSDTSEDDSDGISLKRETDDSDSDDADAQPLAEVFEMGPGEAATATGEFFFLFPAFQKRFFPRLSPAGKQSFRDCRSFFNLTVAHPVSTTQHPRRNLGAAVGRKGLKTRRHLHVRLPQPPELLQMVLVAHGRAPSAKVHQILIRSFR